MGCFTRKSDELGELGDVGKQIEKLHLAGAFNPNRPIVQSSVKQSANRMPIES
jgi:hypothetical protein